MANTATASIPETPTSDLKLESPVGDVVKTMQGGGFGARQGDDRLESINIRRAARLNALNIKQSEIDSLLKERAELINKKFSKEFSRIDERRLAFVRWSLDRIEDARHGKALDTLEAAVAHYENFSHDVQSLNDQLRKFMRTRST